MLRNLTHAGVLVVVPAGFSPKQELDAVSPDACSVAVASSALSFTVSSSSRGDQIGSGAQIHSHGLPDGVGPQLRG